MLHQQERGRLVLWQQFIISFNLIIHHLAGKAIVFADGLSRRPDLRMMLTSASAMLDPVARDIVQAQPKESFARKRMQDAQNFKVQTNWKLVSGILMYSGDAQLRLYVPTALRTRVIREHHDEVKWIASVAMHGADEHRNKVTETETTHQCSEYTASRAVHTSLLDNTCITCTTNIQAE